MVTGSPRLGKCGWEPRSKRLSLRPHAGSTDNWVRVLPHECIKKLCPVHFHSNGSEYIMALTAGKHEGYIHFGTITGKGGASGSPRDSFMPCHLQEFSPWALTLHHVPSEGVPGWRLPEWGWV